MATLIANWTYDGSQYRPFINYHHHFLKLTVQASFAESGPITAGNIFTAVEGLSNAGNKPAPGTKFFAPKAAYEALGNNLYLTHAPVHTLWTAVNDGGTWKMHKQIISIDTILGNSINRIMTETPLVYYAEWPQFQPSYTIRIKAKSGETLRLYDARAMIYDESEEVADDSFTFDGQSYNKVKCRPYFADPIWTGTADVNGIATIDLISAGVPTHKELVVSAEAVGYGESFMTHYFRVGHNTNADPSRQFQIDLLASTATQTNITTGQIEKLYTVSAFDRYDIGTDAATPELQTKAAYSLANLNYSLNNDGIWASTSSGLWLPTGKDSTVYFRIDLGGAVYIYYGHHQVVEGVTNNQTLTVFTSLTDAIDRGGNLNLANETVTWHSFWEVNDKVWINGNVNDDTKAGAGFYWNKERSFSFQVNSSGVMTAKLLRAF